MIPRCLSQTFLQVMSVCSVCVVGCLLCVLAGVCTSCSGAGYRNEDAYSAIPATNNPAVTRHSMNWQPGAGY